MAYHKRLPLFASCSDDGSIQIFHGMVYSDLLQNPLIVPVKILKAGHQVVDSLGNYFQEIKISVIYIIFEYLICILYRRFGL